MDTTDKAGNLQDLIQILVLHKELASLSAWDNWFKCFDPDNLSEERRSIKNSLAQIQNKIHLFKTQISLSLNDDDFASLMNECKSEMESYQETIEQEIELKHRPPDVLFNSKALINLTTHSIPYDIQMNLSFGYKFLSPYVCSDERMPSILAQIEHCLVDSVPIACYQETTTEIHHILSNRCSVQLDDTKRWLSFLCYRTDAFFKKNSDIFATKSDKGGHTVILDEVSYKSKLELHLSDDNYTLIDQDPLQDLIQKETTLIENLREAVKDSVHYKIFRKISFEPKTLQHPKFYGLPKIHKKDTPPRPITSTIGSVGYSLAKMLDRLLKSVFPRSDYHIKDTYEFVKFINNFSFTGDNKKLVSFDVVSMFSSIPFELVFDIIINEVETFRNEFHIDRDLLSSVLVFLLKDCMTFSALDKLYRQNDGLPMGSCISPTAARIVMDKVIDNLLENVPQIEFVKVFVDDTIALLDANCIERALEVLNNFRPGQVKFTLERENDHASINFLNVTLTRHAESISTNWFRKSFASGRLLNFYSSHKSTTVINTAAHFIRTVLALSDPSHYHKNKSVIIQTLKDNSFPETTILVLMNENYTYLRPLSNKDTNDFNFYEECSYRRKPTELYFSPVRTPIQTQTSVTEKDEEKEEEFPPYAIFPHSTSKGRDVKLALMRHKNPGTLLADSTRNTKLNAVSTRKTVTPIAKRKNLILFSECLCKRKVKFVKTAYNQTGEMARKATLTPHKQKCDKHGHAYKKVQFKRGLFYSSQTNYLCRYMQWMLRHKLDAIDAKYEFPLGQLGKILKCSCCSAKNRR